MNSPSGWGVAKLEDLVDILDGKRVPINATERERRVRGKRQSALYPYFGATGQVGWIDDYLFDEPLILLGEDGVPFLERLRSKAYLTDGKVWVNNHAHVLRAREGLVDRRYLQSYLNVFDFTDYVTGSTRLKLTQAAMREIPVPIAPLPEQRRIADKLHTLLARVDACREGLDRVPGILKRFRQSVLAAAVEGKLTEGWRNRRSQEVGDPRPFQVPLVPIGSLVDRARTGPFGSALHKSDYVLNGIPVVNPMHIVDGEIVPTRDMAVSPAMADALQEFRLFAGDVVVARRGVMGRCAVVRKPQEGWLCGTGSLVLRPKSEVDSDYLQLVISSPPVVQALEEGAVGSTMVNLNQRILLETKVPLLPLDEQRVAVQEVRRLLTGTEQIVAGVDAVRGQLEKIVTSVLATAYHGELVSQDPSDEPASLLLDRVRASRGAEADTKTSRLGSSFNEESLLSSLLEAMDPGYEYTRDDLVDLLVEHLGVESPAASFREGVIQAAKAGLDRGILARKGQWMWRTS